MKKEGKNDEKTLAHARRKENEEGKRNNERETRKTESRAEIKENTGEKGKKTKPKN